MTTHGRNGQSAEVSISDNFYGGLGPPEPHALRAAMHTVAHIDKLNEADPMVHRWSLCSHIAYAFLIAACPLQGGLEVLEGGFKR